MNHVHIFEEKIYRQNQYEFLDMKHSIWLFVGFFFCVLVSHMSALGPGDSPSPRARDVIVTMTFRYVASVGARCNVLLCRRERR